MPFTWLSRRADFTRFSVFDPRFTLLVAIQQDRGYAFTARTASQKERLQMLWWPKTGQITQHQTLAKGLGRDGSRVTGKIIMAFGGRH